MRFADASFAALIMIRSSIRCWSTGIDAVCTMKMSAPRIESSYRQYVSPLANVFRVISPSSQPICRPIFCASSGFDRPATSISLLFGVRPIVRPTTGPAAGRSGAPSPGNVCSTVPLSTPPLLDRLPRRESDERIVRNVLGDDGARRRPDVIAERHGCDEHRVDGDPPVATDH